MEAWKDVVSQWAARWEAELGSDYWLTSSGSFFILSELDGEAAESLLKQSNWVAEKVRGALGPLAWEDRPHILIVHVTDEFLAQRFDDAVSARGAETGAERAATQHAPFWMLISSQDEAVMMNDIKPPLVWSSLEHLPLPRWLHAGVAAQLNRVIYSATVSRAPDLFDADLLPAHRRFWNETTIQSFWAGTCETEYPDQSNLFYDLSNILVCLLTEKTKNLFDYLRCAHHDDSGQAAAQLILKIDLGDLAGTFLGAGHWRPDPVAIVECWDRVREISSDQE
jgi:hypothetical protein